MWTIWPLITFIVSVTAWGGVTLHERLPGIVGAGNYTYYSLLQEGTVTIHLHTIDGDADLYVSDKTTQPTFDIENHDFQSFTCGLDTVEITHHASRPIAIGVYGHPSHFVSRYELEVIVEEVLASDYPEFLNEYDPQSYSPGKSAKPSVPSLKPAVKTDGESESIIWTIIVGALKILLEVITS